MTMTSLEVPADMMPDFDATTNSATDETPAFCAVEGCPNPAGTTPTGRRAKYCAEHTNTRPTATTSSAGKRGGWKTGEAEKVETSLNTYLFAICGGLQFTAFAKDGQVVQKTGPAVVHEVVELARTDKALRDVLLKITAPGKYAALSVAALAMIVSVAAVHVPIVRMALPFVPGSYDTETGIHSAKDTETPEGRDTL